VKKKSLIKSRAAAKKAILATKKSDVKSRVPLAKDVYELAKVHTAKVDTAKVDTAKVDTAKVDTAKYFNE